MNIIYIIHFPLLHHFMYPVTAMTFRKPTAKCGFTTTSEEEISKCLLLLRHALATSTDFWFGDSYKKRCQSNADVLTRKGIDCLHVGKTPASLVERLFGANNLAATSLRQLLHVTITAHPGMSACLHHISNTHVDWLLRRAYMISM